MFIGEKPWPAKKTWASLLNDHESRRMAEHCADVACVLTVSMSALPTPQRRASLATPMWWM